jgi:hypothetical protein
LRGEILVNKDAIAKEIQSIPDRFYDDVDRHWTGVWSKDVERLLPGTLNGLFIWQDLNLECRGWSFSRKRS